jgi:TAT (twin-arginine translocation) pathway signal sequence
VPAARKRRDFVKSAGAVAAAAAGVHPGRVFAAPVAQAEETIKIASALLPTL